MAKAILEFEKVSKIYSPQVKALQDVFLKVNQGEFFCLIGPSGCGKTTLLKTVNRLIQPTTGKILVKGKEIEKWNPIELRRNIGYVIQQIGLFPHLTVEENIAYVLRTLGQKKEQRKQRAKTLIQLVGMDISYLKRLPKELSGGQQQRVGVARALAADPEIILMDEPFGALDQITREQLQDELFSLQKKLKKTIFFVTHDLREAVKLADRIGVMKQGVVHQVGSPNELLFSPKDQFVEEFLGSSGFFNVLQLLSVKEGMIAFDSLPKLTIANQNQPLELTPEVIKQAQNFTWNSVPVVNQNRFFQPKFNPILANSPWLGDSN
ncbi:MAG: osmoprotectant transport system ATP-binding protein [Candidatus Atribacteria bacterium]|nr:osmoprotectant transport system ATP-binding protein [Candidatus Atribacteria bacterium]